MIKAEKIFVRVGGGFDPLENLIQRTARLECLEISFRMKNENVNFVDCVCLYLDDLKATEKVKTAFRNSKHCTVAAFGASMKTIDSKQNFQEAKLAKDDIKQFA